MGGIGSRAGCLKFGCFGCLALVGIGVVVVGVSAVLAVRSAGNRRIEPIQLAHDAPPVRSLPPELGPDERGRIVLDVSMCSFSIEPGPVGSPIRVEGSYDAGGYELEEHHDTSGPQAFTYRLTFHRRGPIRYLVQHDEPANRLRLIVPRDVPFVLEGRIGVGESSLELGGLWLTEVDLELGIGEHEMRFSEPLRAPMQRLRLDGSIGELRLLGVGDASPSAVRLDHSVGEVLIDLGGNWQGHSRVEAYAGIGQLQVRVPRDVAVEIEEASVMLGDSLQHLDRPSAPVEGQRTLTLSLHSRIGQIDVETSRRSGPATRTDL